MSVNMMARIGEADKAEQRLEYPLLSRKAWDNP
jgi:hypothetical protein